MTVPLPELPDSPLIPEAAHDYAEAVNLLLRMEFSLVTPSDTRGAITPLVSDTKILVPLPGRMPAPIADLAASPTNAQIATKINELLAAMRKAGSLPT